ncbi:probable WRKY transcription factor 3 [Rosa chinensis]|uniref:probable WRKY transcription factor 3 n=1 Tax=Rosa chinensis TaxID=74649 RepID=UPI000D08A94F|nr:probable WRKY transcription factor 3 [Rosa chinensis]
MAAKHQDSISAPQPQRPVITLPPRPSAEALFGGGSGASPGPMTLVSSFFSDSGCDSEFRSFSQLLAGAMGSPLGQARPIVFGQNQNPVGKEGGGSENGGEKSSGFKQGRPMNLMVTHSPLFTVPPGMSPSGLLNSPAGFFAPPSPFGISHQQALAHVTALAQSNMQMQADYQSSLVAAPTESQTSNPPSNPNEASQQQTAPSTSELGSSMVQSSEASHPDKKYPSSHATDKPADDRYNWRKYGQKQVKGSEYPRSYYKCTHLNCPVKKKVERSPTGEITEIIYKGQHNHDPPQPNKRAKDGGGQNGHMDSQPKLENGLQRRVGDSNRSSEAVPERDYEHAQTAPVQLPSDSEDLGDAETREEGDVDEPNPKRRNIDGVASEVALPHKTVTEPKIIVQTRSEVDLLDDGYRWRKYGQKVVKGNPHPRSYYKCTYNGCNVRKHVERAAGDPKAVITTYEGKHNHDVPAARNSSHNIANNNASQFKPPTVVAAEKHPLLKGREFGNNDQRPVLLQLKEEQIAV